uniref:Uncharacterized protein n=1 Tax=Anopheles dirus TaxID=7168 RepID=A0A182NNY4_9DIPT
GCEALFGVEVTPNIPEAATIVNACSRLVSVSQQIINAVNSLGEPAFVTPFLQNGALALPSSVQQTYTNFTTIARDLSTVTNANSGDLNTLFTSLTTNISTFTDISMEVRLGKWLILMSSSTRPDFSIIPLTLTDLLNFINNTVKPALLKLNANKISQATFYNSVPKQEVSAIAQKLTDLAQFHETVMLPYINRVVSTFRLTSDKMTQFLSTSDQAFQSMEGTLISSYKRFIELSKMFQSAANEMLPTIRTSVDQFTKRMDEFHDLYVGGSAADYAKAAGDMYSSYLQTIANQTTVVVNRLERARNSMSDNPLESVGNALLVGHGVMNQGVYFALQQATSSTKVACAEQVINKFINDFGNLLRNTFAECFTGGEYDISAPVNAQMTTVRDIQNDVAQYFNQLTNAIGGLSNSSPASARMQVDMFLTAYFSQRLAITTTIAQQLVNLATELGVDYDLMIGKSRYCLATSVVVAERMAGSFSQSIFLCF